MATLVHRMTAAADDEGLEIAAGLRRRDPELLDHLIERYHYRLLRYLVFLTGDRALAEDLFQETWIRVLERGHRYDGRARFVAWLLTVARNLALDALRKRAVLSLDALTSRTDDEPPLQIESGEKSPFELLSAAEREDRLAVLVSCLPAHYREALVLRFHEDLGLEEIAVVTRAPLSTVKSRIARGLRALAPRLEAS
jgi:RNA polymerase sigma-70 factor (ECF subfamily)